MGKQHLEKLLTELILKNKESFYRVAFSYVKNKEDALDIIQESIYKALSTVHTLEDPKGLKSWFIRIVINTSIDLLRKKKKEFIADDSTLEVISPVSSDRYKDFDLANSLADLDPKYRIVIILKFFEDLKLRDIAEVLNENENTIKTRLYKGLKMLRLQMDNY
ncbi:sigma-70 family RNA polymerase sigma factor [Bacillus sp. FJAT-52991]|uniref:Sigma-70 family RNA polymerase sigma factor n=1 Tax=Bacillus kandeliae TaxID=3129297 RepID=A0ABZ2N3F1_9BACI